MKWQSMDTAPRDGTAILVCGMVPKLIGAAPDRDERLALGVVHYSCYEWEEYEPASDGLFKRVGKRREDWRASPDHPYAMGVSKPLFWMPIPALPELADAAA